MRLLDIYINECENNEFEWLKNDCVSFSRGWVMLSTGKDPAPEYKKVTTLLQAMRAFRAIGGYEEAGNRVGEKIPPLMAQRGDVVLCRSGGRIGRVSGYTYGVCTGDNIVLPSHEGLGFVDITEGVAAWRLNRSSATLP